MNWHLEKRNINDLKEYYKNPRKLSKKQNEHIKKSLEKYGLIDKPIITKDNVLIGGHQRLKVLKKMGVSEVDCWVTESELTEKDIEELNIRLNKNTGDWDLEMLKSQWDSSDLITWGFTEGELDLSFSPIGTAEEGKVLSPSASPKSKLGDLFCLGDHKLICGDSTDTQTVKKLLGNDIPLLMVTDPPYGVNYDPAWRKDIKGKEVVACRATGQVKNDGQIDWTKAWELFPGSVAYVWHAGKYCSEVQISLENVGFQIINQIIWVKQHFALSRGDYHWKHEPCWYAVKDGAKHNWQGSRKEHTVWEIANLNAFGENTEDERTSHGTQKPLECMRKPILNNTMEGEGVYDPFAGSGTTLLAAEQTNRKSYNVELDPAYCDLIVDRYVNYRKNNSKLCEVVLNNQIINWEIYGN